MADRGWIIIWSTVRFHRPWDICIGQWNIVERRTVVRKCCTKHNRIHTDMTVPSYWRKQPRSRIYTRNLGWLGLDIPVYGSRLSINAFVRLFLCVSWKSKGFQDKYILGNFHWKHFVYFKFVKQKEKNFDKNSWSL